MSENKPSSHISFYQTADLQLESVYANTRMIDSSSKDLRRIFKFIQEIRELMGRILILISTASEDKSHLEHENIIEAIENLNLRTILLLQFTPVECKQLVKMIASLNKKWINMLLNDSQEYKEQFWKNSPNFQNIIFQANNFSNRFRMR